MLQEPPQKQQAERIEQLVQQVSTMRDPQDRAIAEELLQVLLDMYGEGLSRMMEMTASTGEQGYALIDSFGRDELVGSLLLLHGLHPLSIEERVIQALDQVRPYLKSHGGNVELLRVEEGEAGKGSVAYLRLLGSCQGCSASTLTLKSAIEEAVYNAAPDLDELRVKGAAEPPPRLISMTPRKKQSGQGVRHQGVMHETRT